MRTFIEKRPQTLILIFIILIIAVVSSPFWLWHLKSEKTLDILIVDKTVPDQSYREHKGLTWFLNNEKYVKRDGSRYSAENDYIGFKHQESSYTTGKLPEDMDSYKVIYLTDLYGVYEEEFNGRNETGKKSAQLYGGLQREDVDSLEQTLLKGNKTLIAEFNTFGSPTEEIVRRQMTNLLNVKWSGWTGRYFSNLEGKEVPRWLIDQYSMQTGSWNFAGGGFVFVNEDDFIVVLDETELTGNGLDFKLTKAGKALFEEELDSSYQYWFDIIQPLDNDEVLATYKLPLKNKEAADRLAGYGIPLQFPAVIHHQNKQYSSFYFAGDYADEAEVPGIYQTAGLTSWKKATLGDKSFYWSTYLPMISEIFANGLHEKSKAAEPALAVNENIAYNSKTTKDDFQIQRDGKWESLLIKGVNIGMGKPGAFPGEAAITKEEYLRWFKLIGGMNANAIRIYTLHPPAFYEAFYEYNRTADQPLYLFHGAWVNEELMVGAQDAFSKEVTADFQRELKQMVDIVHGKAEIPPSPGHSSGTYAHDISPYVLGFIIGTEWDPGAVLNTNKKHKGSSQFTGSYFKTKDAEPFEIWLAQMMEFTAGYETEQYSWQHTMSFTNWVTTDLLDHPSEPLETEDMVSVNPNHIEKTDKFNAGLFASYHVYPYYPDFLNYEEKYLGYKDQHGKTNPYAGYLHDLISAHEMPVLVAEFGVPASRGLTHKSASGMNQGFLSEEQQGEMNSAMFKSIVEEGYTGGMVFAWQDEWFKRTWNTMDYDNPHRRPYWQNRQTNEQNFGLLSFEPGKQSSAILLDGRIGDWEKKGIKPLAATSTGDVRQFFAAADEAHLYLRLDYAKPINWEKQSTYLLIDTIQNQGQQNFMTNDGLKVSTAFGADFAVELKGPEQSRVLVDSYYDPFYYQYGRMLKMIPEQKEAERNNNGIFNPIRLALNKEIILPATRETLPFQSYETGILKFGTANPADAKFDSLADISISPDKKTAEIRIPWQLLNMKDPGMKEIMGNLYEQGLTGSEKLEKMEIAAVTVSGGEISSALPENDTGKPVNSISFSWKEWEQPQFYERIKKSYGIMKEAFSSTASKEEKE